MKFLSLIIIGFVTCFISISALKAQNVGQTGNEAGLIYKQERSFNFLAHTQGVGAGFRWGIRNTARTQRFIDFSILNMKHPKEVKMGNIYMLDDALRFVYGKKNFVYITRFGLGSQRTLNEKPYWGGVDVRYFYSFGASLSMAKPSYLYILRTSGSSYYYYKELERYDPAEHNLYNIYGRGPFLKGLGKSRFYPGVFFKAGLSFEYGAAKTAVKYIETGVAADVFLKPIPIMAFNKNNNYFLTFYVSINLGKRYNPNVKY